FICTDVQCNKDAERFRDRLKLDHQTGSLTIMNTKTTDSGKYKLEIIKGSDTEKIFIVTVIAKRGEISVKEGENVTLDPGVIKNPVDSMRWYFNDTLIVEITEDQCKIWRDDQCEERFRDRLEVNQTGSLTIKNTTTTDSGVYHLQINSSRFSIIRSFRVTVTATPPPKHTNIERPSWWKVECNTVGFPGGAVQAPIRKVSGPPSGIRVTVFRGRIDRGDKMKIKLGHLSEVQG
ncbi:hypothetical protein cypCar_00047901, partial [Cyprinus carpio]